MQSERGVVHTFLSYKGGTGRTVTCMNVAYHLARAGKRVLVIDLDIDGPGLAILANVQPEEFDGKSILDFFKASPDTSPKNYTVSRSFDTPESSTVTIDLVLAPISFDPNQALSTHGTELSAKMARIRDELPYLYDFILIDSASGISDYSALAVSISDFVTVCFRWSRQHFLGTTRLIHLLSAMVNRPATNYFLDDFFVLANAVPDPESAEEFKRRDEVLSGMREVVNRLKVRNGSETEEIMTISESIEQKWSERVMTSENRLFQEYEHYAQFCLGLRKTHEMGG